MSQLEARGYRFAFGENPDLSQVFYGHKRDLGRFEDRMPLARDTRFDSFTHRWPLTETPYCNEPGKLTVNLNVIPLKQSVDRLEQVLLDVLAWGEIGEATGG
ncbi:hypothetical protein [Amycolatopsis sp. lyj-112]|uniref:hypothetical protein n=1 Tax=Amycolatopsis sp. lyj-112 TaxID=2789288 RepID=UPI003978D80B